MDMRKLGRSGLTVSPLCLGTMMFGDATDEKEARRIIDHARDAGVNFIDTADQYGLGKSEEIIGRAIAKDRDAWVLATKAGNPRSEEHTSELQSLMRISYAVFCLKKKKKNKN